MARQRIASIETRLQEKKEIAARYRESIAKFNKKRFIAWDGEGFNLAGIHRYGLLMNSENTNNILYNYSGLSTLDCLHFLCDNAQGYLGETSVHVCFSANYDVNMILKGGEREIPKSKLVKLYKGERVIYRGFSLEWRPRKSFTVGRFKVGERMFIETSEGKLKPNFDSELVLWDVFGFFQQSFLKALSTFFNPQELEELGYQQIEQGKNRRSDFNPQELEDFIIPYTKLEVDGLVKLMERLNNYCLEAGIQLKRWDGAGAVAASILDKNKIKQHYGMIPPEVMKPTQHAYGGGRNEMIKYGYGKHIYHKDIQSAYPAVNVTLPELATGHWYHLQGDTIVLPQELTENNLSLYLIEWVYPDNMPFYPFFYRDMFGQITYPSQGINWVYHYELEKAIKWNDSLKGHIHIYEQWLYETVNTVKPYAFVADYYEKKRKYKQEKNGVYIVFKLGINSLYGKTVQHLGYDEDTGKLPPYFQLQYGGAITSKTRASLFDAAMQAPDACIAMATDGLWTTRDITVPCSEKLGDWEDEILQDGTFIQSGIYFATKGDGTKIHHYRGFDRDSFMGEDVLHEWLLCRTFLYLPHTRFVTLGSALASDERFKVSWCQWEKGYRKLMLHPCEGRKRVNITPWTPDNNPSMHLFDTLSRSEEGKLAVLEHTISYPFPLPWDGRKEYEEFKRANREEGEILQEIEESLGYPGDNIDA